LLKKKADALKARHRALLAEIRKAKMEVAKMMPESFISLASAVYSAGEFKDDVICDVKEASFRVFASQDNVAGVRLPVFTENFVDENSSENKIGLSRGGNAVDEARKNFRELLVKLVKLGTLTRPRRGNFSTGFYCLFVAELTLSLSSAKTCSFTPDLVHRIG